MGRGAIRKDLLKEGAFKLRFRNGEEFIGEVEKRRHWAGEHLKQAKAGLDTLKNSRRWEGGVE